MWRADPVLAGPTVVFDVDGVLSDATHRQHYLEGPGMYWDAFFAACGEDPLIVETARAGQLLAADYRVVLLTARPIRGPLGEPTRTPPRAQNRSTVQPASAP